MNTTMGPCWRLTVCLDTTGIIEWKQQQEPCKTREKIMSRRIPEAGQLGHILSFQVSPEVAARIRAEAVAVERPVSRATALDCTGAFQGHRRPGRIMTYHANWARCSVCHMERKVVSGRMTDHRRWVWNQMIPCLGSDKPAETS